MSPFCYIAVGYRCVARYYESAIGRFTSVDPLAEKYYSWSPYVYVGNNPIIRTDPTGMDWVWRVADGVTEVYYDRNVRSQADVTNIYGEKSGVTHMANGSTLTQYGKDSNIKSQYTFTNDAKNNKYGTVTDMNGDMLNSNEIRYGSNYTIFGTSDNSANAETLHKNLFGTSYIGANNPKDYMGNDSYQYLPRNTSEYPAYQHDSDYDALKAVGATDAFANINTYQADRDLANRSLQAVFHNNSIKDRLRAAAVYGLFNNIANAKHMPYMTQKKAGAAAVKNIRYPMPYSPF